MTRDEDTFYVYQWSGNHDKWLLKDRTTVEPLSWNLFSIRCQQHRDARVMLMHGEDVIAERGVYEGSLAFPVLP